jgi:hypothetical protein
MLVLLLAAALPAGAEELELVLRYQRLELSSLEAGGPAEVLGPSAYRYPLGVKVEWNEGARLEALGHEVFHETELGYFSLNLPADSLRLIREGEALDLHVGSFDLEGGVRLEAPGFQFETPGGRYTREGAQVVITLRAPFWIRGGSGFLMALLIGIFTLILVINGRRMRRKLAEPVEFKRPRPD